MWWQKICFSLIYFIWMIMPAVAADNNDTLTIEADSAEVFHDRQEAMFYHNVIAKTSDMDIRSERLKISYSQVDQKATAKKNINQRIKTVEFFEDVFIKIQQTGEKIYSDYASFNNITQKLEAKGHLKIIRSEGTLTAERYIYDSKNKKSEIFSKQNANKMKDDERITIIIEKNSLMQTKEKK